MALNETPTIGLAAGTALVTRLQFARSDNPLWAAGRRSTPLPCCFNEAAASEAAEGKHRDGRGIIDVPASMRPRHQKPRKVIASMSTTNGLMVLQ
jgi:hypothetical protein